MRDLEFLTVLNAVYKDIVAEDTHIRPLMETLLVNQFHDILPGTCIAKAHDQSYQEMEEVLEKADQLIQDAICAEPEENTVTVINTLGFDRDEVVYVKDFEGKVPVDKELITQPIQDIHGQDMLCIGNLHLPSMGSKVIQFKEKDGAADNGDSAFVYEDNVLTTPFAKVTFAGDGTIESFIDTRVNRELRGNGLPLNTFLMAEDVPTAWDS